MVISAERIPINISPVKVNRESSGQGLGITWSDGTEVTISSAVLRKHCPCATCAEQRGDLSHDKPLSPPRRPSLNIVKSELDQELQLQTVWAIGNYALGIRWGDGHDSGIYSFALLLALAKDT